MGFFKHSILIALFASLVSCSLTKNNGSREITSYIDSLVRKTDFNGNVLVAIDDKVIFKGNFGLSNFYTREKLNDSTVFLLCSISKQFTAAGIMILKEKGLLSYEDNILKYIPELPYEGISIRNMLTHTSGLPKYESFLVKRMKEKPSHAQ